ncbi:YjiH family protein [Eremococcus coleocola]|uniref:Transporter gate domain protein n=1 Tax=Eremococcus coleocola ACS-139-V-Col8 TaxID=908337 RepID=E4KN35_9LACT|nr:YjiH family protein [Eremococcus coleocola]EFR31620.1 transporter gate domain protein [Eremococcus coleocola ACS-139-V-Col8]
MNSDQELIQNRSAKDILLFLLPSLLGVFLLMTPLVIEGQSTVMVSVIANFLRQQVSNFIPIYYLVLVIISFSTVIALIYRFSKPTWLESNRLLKEVADISPLWLLVRVTGCVLAWLVAFGRIWGLPEIIWSPDTGGLILFDLINGLFIIFLVAAFILPFLTEFGLLEYVGVFLTPFMRPIFNLPGRSAVDCVASWIGDGTIGVTLTNKQYEEGYYNAREAAVISTTFSAVSITFCLVVVENINMMDKFGFFYLTTIVAGIACALIVPRIWPLSGKANTYYLGKSQDIGEDIPVGYSKHQWAMELAIKKARTNGNPVQYLKSALKTVLGLWLSVIPSIMAIGTLVLIVSQTTPIFEWLGFPFRPILHLLQVPLADQAASTMVIGFADMVVPSIMAAAIANPMTQFIIACISIVQLIYMSETGAVILGSNLPVSFTEIFIIFIERTLISLPIIVLMAHLIF